MISALNPVAVFIGVWIAILLPGLAVSVVFAADVFSASAYWMILCFTVLVFVGGSCVSAFAREGNEKRVMTEKQFRSLQIIYYTGVVLFCLDLAISLKEQVGLLRVSDILSLPGFIAGKRYTAEEIADPTPIALLRTFRYFAPAIHGFVCSDSNRKGFIRAGLFWLIPGLLMTLIFSSRSQFMFYLTFWLAGYITGGAYHGTALRSRFKTVFKAVILFILLGVPFAYAVYAVRWGITAGEQVNWAKPTMAVFGTPLVISDWLDRGGLANLSQDFELKSMYSLGHVLGLSSDLTPGIYAETVAVYIGDDEAMSNIFSAFRPLLDDFGVVGAGFLTLFASLTGACGWRLLRAGRVLGVPFLLTFIVWSLWSPITSALSYNAVLAALALASGSIMLSLWFGHRAVPKASFLLKTDRPPTSAPEPLGSRP